MTADGVAANAFLITNVTAALGNIGSLIAEYLVQKKATLVGGDSGAVAGLVAITPASGSAGVVGAIIIGPVGGTLGFFGVAKIKKLFKVETLWTLSGSTAWSGSGGPSPRRSSSLPT